MGLVSGQTWGQSGTITGEVFDAESGLPLESVSISVAQADLGAYTDSDGQYVIRQLPAGEHTLVFDYAGYNELPLSVTVSPGEQNTQQAELEPQNAEGDEIFVLRTQRELARTYDRQKESMNYGSAVTFNQMDHFGDHTVEDALARISGVQAGNRREVNLRGVGRDRYNVTLDGQQIATTGAGERSVDLAGISTDLVRDVEVIKIPTPDMHADALGGTINLVTNKPLEARRDLNVIVGGGANPAYFGYGGATTRASVNYNEVLHEDVTLSVNLNQQLDHRGRDMMGMGFEVADFGDGPVDVLERVETGLENMRHNRIGGRVRLDYQPTEQTSYFFRGVVNTDNQQHTRHIDSWNANGDWIDQTTTGAESELGAYFHEAFLNDIQLEQYLLQGGGNHQYENMELTYNAGWSHSRSDRSEFVFPFRFDEVNFDINMDNRERPSMEITNRQVLVLDDGSINRDFILGQNFERTLSEYIDNTFSAEADVEIPFNFGEVTVGSSALVTLKEGDYQESSLENQRTLRMQRFNMHSAREVDVMDGDYNLPWLVRTEDARTFLQNQRPSFEKDEDLERMQSDIRNYDAFEQIYAGYGMATLEFGQLTALGGVRAEYTASEYEGYSVLFNEEGEHESSERQSETVGYVNLFPNLHLVSRHLGDQTKLGAAYSRTIRRPDFGMLAPFELTNSQDETLFRGNPELDPMMSDNMDFYVDHYFTETGKIGLNLFYKNLSDVIVTTEQTVEGGNFDGWKESSFSNSSEEASLYGLEVSWQQKLDFLPGVFSNFGTYANYTWSESEYQPEGRNEEIALPHQSPHVVNAALNYIQGRFFTQVTYHWTDEYLNAFQTTRQSTPSLGEVYMDQYEEGWSDVSASFRFRISDNFRFWAEVNNLLETETLRYDRDRDFYPAGAEYRNGRSFRVGIRYDL